jgi:hypothetical protein
MAQISKIGGAVAAMAMLAGATAGCVSHSTEYRVVGASDPRQLGIARIEIGKQQAVVVADKEQGLLRDHAGEQTTSVTLGVGDSFNVFIFNGSETWKLLGVFDDHAVFDLHGGRASCVGILPFWPFWPYSEYTGTVTVCGRQRSTRTPEEEH